MIRPNTTYQFNTLFLSDTHLGCKDCKAEYLLNFLNRIACKKLFLLGDIIDLYALKRQSLWPDSHQAIIKKLHSLQENGTEIIYIPGNHDEALRDFTGTALFGFSLMHEYTYRTVNNKQLLLLHGDLFDGIVLSSQLISYLGDKGYDLLLFLNRWAYRFRKKLGLSYFSIASHIKKQIKSANATITNYENAAIDEAKRRQLDGIICGHIHQPILKTKDNILYMNCGDWIENCTAVVEHLDGSFELLHCSEHLQQLAVHTTKNAA